MLVAAIEIGFFYPISPWNLNLSRIFSFPLQCGARSNDLLWLVLTPSPALLHSPSFALSNQWSTYLASFYVSKMQDLSSSCCANIAKLFPCKADSIRRIYTQLSHICRTEEWEQKPLKGEDLNSECFRLRDTFMR